MAKLSEITAYLDEELKLSEVPDYPGAHNGLQLENSGEVHRVAAAVDASLSVIEKAGAEEVDLLIVHHGMFWQGVKPLTGALYQKLKLAMDAGLAIYSAHIPLDIHPSMGNNILLAEQLGLALEGAFHPWNGIELGVKGRFTGTLGDLRAKLSNVLEGPVLICGNDEDEPGVVGIITGGAGSEVESVAAAGIDTFITGEGPHWSYPLAEELGLNFLYGGHYATETFGVIRVAAEISAKFGTHECFIDRPTGL